MKRKSLYLMMVLCVTICALTACGRERDEGTALSTGSGEENGDGSTGSGEGNGDSGEGPGENPEECVGDQLTFDAKVLEVYENSVLVECTGCESGLMSVGDQVSVSTKLASGEECPELAVGDSIRVVHNPVVMETYPLQLEVVYEIYLNEDHSTGQGMTGISKTASTDAYMDEWGIKLTVRDISPTGLTIVCEQQHVEPAGELQTGSPYILERLTDSGWEKVEMLPLEYDVAWTMEAWTILPEETTEWKMSWEPLYGALEAGSYRIGKEITDFREAGDCDTKMYYAAFDIVDLGETSEISYSYDGKSIALGYVEGWEYQVEEYDENGYHYGLRFRPTGENGWVDLVYNKGFGVCGTGLKSEDIVLANGLEGTKGTYDNSEIWSFIHFHEPYWGYVAMTEGVKDWWQQYGEEAMDILGTAVLAETEEQ